MRDVHPVHAERETALEGGDGLGGREHRELRRPEADGAQMKISASHAAVLHRCLSSPRSPNHSTYGNENTCNESVATMATYCLPFLPVYVIGFALPCPGSCATHSSLPFFESNARMRRSLVAPT